MRLCFVSFPNHVGPMSETGSLYWSLISDCHHAHGRMQDFQVVGANSEGGDNLLVGQISLKTA